MTAKGLVKILIALVIIGAGAAIGWAVATSTNPYAPGATSPAAAAPGNNTAARPTAIPTFTPASGATGTGASTTSGAGATRGQNGQAGAANTTPGAAGAGAQFGGQGQRSAPVTGTVQTFDASSKVLTVKDPQGKSEEFDATNARVTKTEKLSADDFSKTLSSNGIILLTGEKGSDGTYNAVSLVALETGGFGGANGAAGANTTPGAGAGAGNGGARRNAGGTPGAGAGANGGTPGARGAGGNFGGGGAAGGFGAANGAVVVRGGALQGQKFTGTSMTGEAITANISDSTLLEKQAAGTLDDLKPGANVAVTARAATAGGPAQAVAINLT